MTVNLVGFQLGFNGDFADTLENAKANTKYLDHFVVIEDSSKYHAYSEEQRKEILEGKCHNIVIRQSFPFKDNLPEQYQHGVDAAPRD